MSKSKPNRNDESGSSAEVKSAMELALEKASRLDDEPIEIETENGPVSMSFDELKAKAAQADELANQMLYKAAEFDNFRKRTAREREDLLKETVRVGDLFDILDHFDRALESDGDTDTLREGFQLIRGQMWALLERKEIERVPGVGEPFDPNFHEAVSEQAHESIPQGNVASEFQSGFRIGNRVLRPSKVVVSSGPPRNER
jgi:molecular chaperone GrpE